LNTGRRIGSAVRRPISNSTRTSKLSAITRKAKIIEPKLSDRDRAETKILIKKVSSHLVGGV